VEDGEKSRVNGDAGVRFFPAWRSHDTVSIARELDAGVHVQDVPGARVLWRIG
jgi:hypothetical protein